MTWKNTERALAKRLNGRRLGATGRATADVVSDWLSVEVKHRKALPLWLRDALDQARLDAGGRLPIVILHECGRRHSEDLVLLRLSDFESWFGDMRCRLSQQEGL